MTNIMFKPLELYILFLSMKTWLVLISKEKVKESLCTIDFSETFAIIILEYVCNYCVST